MSRTYRRNKGKDSLKNTDNDYLKDVDVEHADTHGRVEIIKYEKNGEMKTWKYNSLPYCAKLYVPLVGKQRRREKAMAHKDGIFAYGIGQYYKKTKWRQQRRYYSKSIRDWVFYDKDVISIPNPDSSWEAW
jgi:hypothetical protein